MKLNSIQMLRGVAALLVVYTHSVAQMAIFAPSWQLRTPVFISMATFGVDLFFVISGFVIYHSAERLNGRTPALSFLWHRFRRINPVYYAVVLLTVTTWIPSLLRHQRPPVTGWQLLSWTILLPLPGDPARAISQAWTLSFEWFFYLLFFLLILLRAKGKGWILCCCLGGLSLLGWLLRSDLTGLAIFYTDPLLLEFLLGVALGIIYRRWSPGRKIAFCLLVPGLVLGLLFMLTGFGNSQAVLAPPPPLRYLHAIYWGSTAALVVAGCVFLEKAGKAPRFFRHRAILLLGDASYSIYLFHLLVLGLIAAIYLRVGFFLNADVLIPIHAVIAVAVSLLFYKWVELPLLNWLRSIRPSRPPRSIRSSDPPRPIPPRSAKP
jgi:exopolysaccharide production protein ExoZ